MERRYVPSMRRMLLLGALSLGCFVDAPALDDGGGACPDLEEPEPGAECPAICNGGCVDRECQILCRGDHPCTGEIACPQDFACDFDCEGTGVCEGAVLVCPGDFACSLSCAGPSACAMAELACGFSECAIECGPDDTACTGTHVRCSTGACLAVCVPGAVPWLEGCEDSCSCVEC